ncbi:MAG: glycoside hydrolase family 3 protein [Lachnospira sp.]|nr:glycoside hydrolase family 3 protein [Lachnospira sp.]
MKKALITFLLLAVITFASVLCSCGVMSNEEKVSEQPTHDVSISESQNSTELQTGSEIQIETEKETQSQTQTVPETQKETERQTEAMTQPSVLTTEQKVEKYLSDMTLEEKIYQMMIVTPEQLTDAKRVTTAGNETRQSLKAYPVGGIIYFESNLVTPTQTMAMIANTQMYNKEVNGLPLFMCIDEEGGRIARIANLEGNPFKVTKFELMSEVKDANRANIIGSTIGTYLKNLGFNVNFAPNTDVLTNLNNSVIGNRSFGSDPYMVRDKALAYARGLRGNGVLATYKHFPGHGATEGDTHDGFAYTNKTLDELKNSELIPFASAAENKIDFVMTAHISVPNIIGDNTPVSLSYDMVTGVLKNQLGYKGIIVTDALRMGAVTQVYSNSQIAVMAVKAGNDMLLIPQDYKGAVKAIKDAVNSGVIKQSRIDESVRKILRVKLTMN